MLVNITYDGKANTTSITTEDGESISGVRSFSFNAAVDSIGIADLTLVMTSLKAEKVPARFRLMKSQNGGDMIMQDPATSEFKYVRSITFTDGTQWYVAVNE